MSHQLRIRRAIFVSIVFFQISACTSNGARDTPITGTSTVSMDGGTYPEPPYPNADAGSQSDDAGDGGNGGSGGSGGSGNSNASSEFGAPPPPTQDYVLDAETATSKSTGLMWLRATLDTRFTGGSCVNRCQELITAGHDDWRSPTIDELKGILVTGTQCPLIDKDAFPLTICSWYTSSETKIGSGDDYLMVSFYSGAMTSRFEASMFETGFSCRCVR